MDNNRNYLRFFTKVGKVGFVVLLLLFVQKVSAQNNELFFHPVDTCVISQKQLINGDLIFVPDLWSRNQISYDDSIKKKEINYCIFDDASSSSLFISTINFRVNKSIVEAEFLRNAQEIKKLNQVFRDKENVDKLDYIIIFAGSSLEGNSLHNKKLAIERARAMKSFLIWKYPYLNRDIIYPFAIGENLQWKGLKKMVEADMHVPQRVEVLSLLDEITDNEKRFNKLKQIANGEAYSYLNRNMFTKLRGATTIAFYLKKDNISETLEYSTSETKKDVNTKIQNEHTEEEKNNEKSVDILDYKDIVEKNDTNEEMAGKIHKFQIPTIAFKTNLLYDVVSAINFEIEIPVSRRWSIAGEYLFPWWLNENKQFALQNLACTIEGRYWLGERYEDKKLTGYFVGLYGGAGYYDIKLKKDNGYQGEFFHTGISLGFVQTLFKNRNWRVEYSIGLGHFDTNFREYVPKYGLDNKWHLIRQRNANVKYIGPTRAKVSIVWILNNK